MDRHDQFHDKDTRWPPERRASVFLFPWFYRVHSWAVYGMAGLDPERIDALLPTDLTAPELGAAAWVALRASRYLEDDAAVAAVRAYVATRPSKRIFEEMKKQAGVRSVKALFGGAGSVDLIWTKGTIELEPHRSLGGGRWMRFENREPIRFAETVSDAELGAALLAALQLSRNGSYEGT